MASAKRSAWSSASRLYLAAASACRGYEVLLDRLAPPWSVFSKEEKG